MSRDVSYLKCRRFSVVVVCCFSHLLLFDHRCILNSDTCARSLFRRSTTRRQLLLYSPCADRARSLERTSPHFV